MAGCLAPRSAGPPAEPTPTFRPRMSRQVRLLATCRRLQRLIGMDLARPLFVLKLSIHINEREKRLLRQLHPGGHIRWIAFMRYDAPDAPLPIQLVLPHVDRHTDHARGIQIRNHAGRLKRRCAHAGQFAADRTSRRQRRRQGNGACVRAFARHLDAVHKYTDGLAGISARIVQPDRQRQIPFAVAVLQLERDAVAARQIPVASDAYPRITGVAAGLDLEHSPVQRERSAGVRRDRRQRRLRRIEQHDIPRMRHQRSDRRRHTNQISHPASSLLVETNYIRPFRDGQSRSCELNPRFCELSDAVITQHGSRACRRTPLPASHVRTQDGRDERLLVRSC